jgi:hypothetical protein
LLGLALNIFLAQRIVLFSSIAKASTFCILEKEILSSCSKSGISASSSSCITLKDKPFAPALAVRPDLCTYAS